MDAAPRWAWRAASCPHTVTALAQQPWPCVWGRQDGLTDGPMLAVVSLVGKPAVPGAPASSRTPPRAGGERNVTLYFFFSGRRAPPEEGFPASVVCATSSGFPRHFLHLGGGRVLSLGVRGGDTLTPPRATCRLATCGRPRARSAVRGRGGVSAACRCWLRSVGALGWPSWRRDTWGMENYRPVLVL